VPTFRAFLGVRFTPTNHDGDADGITDSEDECPEDSEDRDGVEDGDGCPEEDADFDHDGVADGFDECPEAKETINGIDDDDGCPDSGDRRVVYEDGQFTVLDTIRFELGSAQLTPGSYPLLDQVALTLKANPEIEHMRVEGHTDDTGPRALNMRLSEDRARAVRRYLVQKGVGGTRLRVRSYGPDRPMEEGTDADARAKNRRVEFVLE
jgi:outer membrane protein OmpA-like peptidoglycan-associated protein